MMITGKVNKIGEVTLTLKVTCRNTTTEIAGAVERGERILARVSGELVNATVRAASSVALFGRCVDTHLPLKPVGLLSVLEKNRGYDHSRFSEKKRNFRNGNS